MRDWETVRLAWSAVDVFAIDTRLADYVDQATAARIRVHPQRGARCVMVSALPADLRNLAAGFRQWDQPGNTPLARRTGALLARRIEAKLREAQQ